MIEATDLKNGTTFLSDGKPYKVIKYTHVKIGRGGAIVRVNARNLKSGGTEEKTFNSGNKIEEINTSKRLLQFLYDEGNSAVFMDPKSYEQIEIPKNLIKDQLAFVKEGEEINVLFWEDVALSLDIPPKITISVADTPPGIKGNSATNIYKPARLENGQSVKVPLFINNGDKVVVDTRTGEYVERAK